MDLMKNVGNKLLPSLYNDKNDCCKIWKRGSEHLKDKKRFFLRELQTCMCFFRDTDSFWPLLLTLTFYCQKTGNIWHMLKGFLFCTFIFRFGHIPHRLARPWNLALCLPEKLATLILPNVEAFWSYCVMRWREGRGEEEKLIIAIHYLQRFVHIILSAIIEKKNLFFLSSNCFYSHAWMEGGTNLGRRMSLNSSFKNNIRERNGIQGEKKGGVVPKILFGFFFTPFSEVVLFVLFVIFVSLKLERNSWIEV